MKSLRARVLASVLVLAAAGLVAALLMLKSAVNLSWSGVGVALFCYLAIAGLVIRALGRHVPHQCLGAANAATLVRGAMTALFFGIIGDVALSGMPAFDKFAYSDGRCFGLKAADLKARQLSLFDPPATLAPNEVEYLADFLMAKVVGKGPLDHAKCIEFWGADVEVCKELP